MFPIVFVLLQLLLAVGLPVAVIVWVVRRNRRRQSERAAAIPILNQMGFWVDPTTTPVPPFPFVDLTNTGTKVDFRITGNGTQDTAFHFWYVVGFGNNKQTIRRSCAVLPLPFHAPPISIWRGGRTPFGALGGNRVDSESPAFNSAYEVSCADERFAFTALNYEVIEWFLHSPPAVHRSTVRLNGPWMIMMREQVADLELPQLLQAATSLRAAFPKVLVSLYPYAVLPPRP